MPKRRAFTLVEMLIVVSIIGLLLGITLSALSGAQKRGMKTRELNRLRQVVLAWTMYSGQSGEQVLPGFLDVPTQTTWGVNYRNRAGADLDRSLSQTYSWRLLPFLDFNLDPMMGHRDPVDMNLDESDFRVAPGMPALPAEFDTAATLPGAGAAIEPGFGYNAFYLGGWWTNSVMVFGDARYTEGTIQQRGKVVSRSTSHIRRPSEINCFVSSTWRAPGRLNEPFDLLEGFGWCVPPWLAETQVWSLTDGALDVLSTQAVPLPRYGSTVSVGFCDGHTGNSSLENLEDPRAWIGNASSRTFQHTTN